GDLDENRDVAARSHRHTNERDGKPENLVEHVVETEPLVFAGGVPTFQMDHEFHALGQPRRRDAEHVFAVDQPYAATFHVVARQFRARADEDRFGTAADFDGVVGHQTVSADDQV